jgi:SAM-dependent methyltransferase
MTSGWNSDLAPDAYDAFFARVRARPGAALLDVSAGYELVSLAAAGGLTVTSIDCPREILQAAKQGARIALPHPEDRFAGVLCAGTFYYLDREYAPVLAAEIERVLAPGGLALASFAPVAHFPPAGRTARRPERRALLGPRPPVPYQNREIEGLFRGMKIVSLVTQVNGVRRLVAAKKG